MKLDTLDVNVLVTDNNRAEILCSIAAMYDSSSRVMFVSIENPFEQVLELIRGNMKDTKYNVNVYDHLVAGDSMFKLYKTLLSVEGDIDVLVVDNVNLLTQLSNDSLQAKIRALSDVRKELGCEVWTSIDMNGDSE